MPGLRQASGIAIVVGVAVLAFVIGVFRILLGRGLGLGLPTAGVDLVLLFLGHRAGVFPLGRAGVGQRRGACQGGGHTQGAKKHQPDSPLSYTQGSLQIRR